MMSIKAVVFDLDGVLVETDKLHYLAWKQVCEENGIPFDEAVNHKLRGIGRRESLDIILSECGDMSFSDREKDGMTEKKNEIYLSFLRRLGSKDVSGKVISVLKRLKMDGIHLAVASSSKNARLVLEKTGLCNYFEVMVDGTMITRAKPDPQVFRLAAGQLKIPPERCLVVEDAEAGIIAAKAGGMRTVLYGRNPVDEMADHTINDITELVNIVTDSCGK